ncbi:hypothetical protein NM213_04880 [Pseudomonas lactis]|uniref:hypothetical protein n=1 Tax=Pseudomonas lactis TaxID=1615674 RepID=UPI001F1F741A|nr:hypothetical protein [Pseudomonas lactis]MDR8369246.1 hypothetical protein [Pseudomonas lactis]
MRPDKISFSLSELTQSAPIEGIDLNRKNAAELKNNYVVCAGGKTYLLTDLEFKALQGWLSDYPGRIHIAEESVIYTSPKGEAGVTSVRPY